MNETIGQFVTAWASRDGDVIDIAEATTDLALAVLERTIFSAGIANGRDNLRAAMRIYFDSLGRIDPFDLLSLPDFVPRLSRLYARPAIRIFHQAVDDMIAARERDLAKRGSDTPHDILMLMIGARDAQSDRRLTRQEIRANVITFLAAGHESTANAITWALYLLSRSPEWRERVRAEAEKEMGSRSTPAFTSVRNVPNTWALRKKLRKGLSARIIVGRSTPITERTMFVLFSQFFCVVSVTSAFAVHEFSLRITMPVFGSNQSNETPSVFCLRYRAVSSPVRAHMSM